MSNSQETLFPDSILLTEGFEQIGTGQFALVEFEPGKFALCEKQRKVGFHTRTEYGTTWQSVPVITQEMQREVHVSLSIDSTAITF